MAPALSKYTSAFVANARLGPEGDRTRILVLAEQGNRVKIPDTGQILYLICSCKNEVPALRAGARTAKAGH